MRTLLSPAHIGRWSARHPWQAIALWLEPEVQGRGLGRRLWDHALTSAAALGYRSLMLEADPNAEGFYAAMGATRIGERESPLAQKVEPGRALPLMRIELDG